MSDNQGQNQQTQETQERPNVGVAKIEMKKDEKKKEKKGVKTGIAWLMAILSLFLGFIIGVGSVFGTVAGVVYFVGTRPLDDTVNKIDNLAGTELYATLFGKVDENGNLIEEGVFNEKYADLKIKDLVGDLATAVSSFSEDGGSLSALHEVTPIVGKSLDELSEKVTAYGITLDREALLSAPFSSHDENAVTLSKYIENCVMDIAVGDLLYTVMEGDVSPILMALCYGEEDVDYTINDAGEIVMNEGSQKTTLKNVLSSDTSALLDKLAIASLMEIDLNDPIMRALAYGHSSRYEIVTDPATKAQTVQMNQIAYAYENGTFTDEDGNELSATREGDGWLVTPKKGGTQYVENIDGEYLAFTSADKSKQATYPKKKISDLLEGGTDKLMSAIEIAPLLKVTAKSEPIMLTLAYGKEGVDYSIDTKGTEDASDDVIVPITAPKTIADIKGDELLNDLKNEMTIGELVGDTGDSKIVQAISDWTIADLMSQEKLDTLTLGDVLDIQETTGILAQIKTWKLGELNQEKLDTLTLGDVIDIQETEGILASIKGWKIGELNQEKINTLKIGDVLSIDENETGILGVMKDWTLGECNQSKIDTLKLGDVLAISDDNPFLSHLKNSTLNSVDTDIQNLTVQQVFADDIWKTEADGSKTLNREWWYLLHNEKNCRNAGHTEQHCNCISDFKLTEINDLVADMKENMHLATLNDLSNDGMLALSSESLNKEVFARISYYPIKMEDASGNLVTVEQALAHKKDATGKIKYGYLSVEELVAYVDGIVAALELVNG